MILINDYLFLNNLRFKVGVKYLFDFYNLFYFNKFPALTSSESFLVSVTPTRSD
jgi:hypothetical protein